MYAKSALICRWISGMELGLRKSVIAVFCMTTSSQWTAHPNFAFCSWTSLLKAATTLFKCFRSPMFCFTLDMFQVSPPLSLFLVEVFDYFVGRAVSDSLVVSIKKSTDISFVCLFVCCLLLAFLHSTSLITTTCSMAPIHPSRIAF